MAHVCVVNKVDSAPPEGVEAVLESIRVNNPEARVVRAASPFLVEGDAEAIRGKRVLAIEDGPTLTHGEMTYGAAVLAAKAYGAASLVDPRPVRGRLDRARPSRSTRTSASCCRRWATAGGSARSCARRSQRSDAELVLIGTPIDLRRVIELDKPALRVTYRLEEIGEPTLASRARRTRPDRRRSARVTIVVALGISVARGADHAAEALADALAVRRARASPRNRPAGQGRV